MQPSKYIRAPPCWNFRAVGLVFNKSMWLFTIWYLDVSVYMVLTAKGTAFYRLKGYRAVIQEGHVAVPIRTSWCVLGTWPEHQTRSCHRREPAEHQINAALLIDDICSKVKSFAIIACCCMYQLMFLARKTWLSSTAHEQLSSHSLVGMSIHTEFLWAAVFLKISC